MNKKLQIWLPFLLSITLITGMLLGYTMSDTMPGKNFFSLEKPHPLQEVLELIKNKYVDDVKLRDLSDTAIAAILEKLDPHSAFIPADELQNVNEDIAGNFFGIGVEFNIIDDTIQVVNVVPKGPSEKAGILSGDKFIKVNDSMVAGKKISSERIRKLLRGDIDTKVSVVILRDWKQKTVVISRGIIPVSSIDASYMIDSSTGYIRLNKFSQVTYHEFMQALGLLKKQRLQKLILDLRGNGGGVLDEATAIADEFLDGDKLITYTEGKHFPKKEYRCKKEGLFEKGKLVILCDEGSASASEILIGALQDWDRATIVGRRSFGKGLVQEQYDLSDGSALRLTIARYFTPIGRSIQRSYSNGGKAYYNEIENRFHDGEMLTMDSLKNDSLHVFKTNKGKVLYGSGGITPDIFVALDTNTTGIASGKLFFKGTIGTFAYTFYHQNRETFKQYKLTKDFAQNFTFSNDAWMQFLERAKKDSIVLDKISIVEKNAIIQRIKAGIARQIWRNEGYFEIMNREDTTVKKAMEYLNLHSNPKRKD